MENTTPGGAAGNRTRLPAASSAAPIRFPSACPAPDPPRSGELVRPHPSRGRWAEPAGGGEETLRCHWLDPAKGRLWLAAAAAARSGRAVAAGGWRLAGGHSARGRSMAAAVVLGGPAGWWRWHRRVRAARAAMGKELPLPSAPAAPLLTAGRGKGRAFPRGSAGERCRRATRGGRGASAPHRPGPASGGPRGRPAVQRPW